MAKIATQQDLEVAIGAINDAARAGYTAVINRGLDTPHRRQALAQVYVDAKAKISAAKQELVQNSQDDVATAEADLFGIPGPKPASAADRAALAANMRDALERAAECKTPKELVTVLERWAAVGDAIGERACAAVAFQRITPDPFAEWATNNDGDPTSRPDDWRSVIFTYAENHPADADRILALTSGASQEQWKALMRIQAVSSVARAVELSMVQDWELEQIARGNAT